MTLTAESDTLAAIREAATRLFYEQGYHATTLRQIATDAGLKVGSLYYHIAGKEPLLLDLMCRVLDDLLAQAREAAEAEDAAIDRLRAAIALHIRFHAERAAEVFVGSTELRSLSADGRRIVIAKREEYEALVERLIEDAVATGHAGVIDLRTHLYSLLAQGTHVAGWYRPGRSLSVADLGHAYSELALRGLAVAGTV